MRLRFDIEMHSFQRDVETIRRRWDRQISTTVYRAAKAVKERAIAYTPVDRGDLRRAYKISKTKDGKQRGYIVKNTAKHFGYVEYGTGIYGQAGGRRTAWTYWHHRYGLVRTRGQRPKKMMRKAYKDVKKMLPSMTRNVR